MTVVALLLVLAQAPGAPARAITGVVVDTSGAPIPGARVTLSVQGQHVGSVSAGDDGTFAVGNGPAARVTLLVSAPGFTDQTVILDGRSDAPVRIELRPRGLIETVTVSANPSELRVTTPASATVLDVEMLATMPAWTLDDQLRTVPGFSLFRRSSSRVANPTTQGATLRGLSASGASRTLVLADGIPLNDPFGGWVYWDRVPAAALQRVEVARGGSGDLHGSDALGGAIRLETAGGSGARLLLDGGTSGTARGSAYGGRDLGSWQIFAAGEAFTTDGFVIIAPESRGPIDTPAASRHASVFGGTGRTFQGGARFDARASYFTEDRDNGTPFQANGTIVRQASGSASGNAWGGSWNARAYGASQDYDQTFSAVAADRASERPTTLQHVDSASGAGTFEWLRGGAGYAWLLSGSFRQVESDLIERSALAPEAPVALTQARQRAGAVVVQGSFVPTSRLTVGAGVRGEIWLSELKDGSLQQTAVDVFPRASIAWRLNEMLSLRAAAHNAYRTPTINELFRPFRVGNVLTRSNPALRPEESYGLEGAAFLRRGPAALRVTGFWTRLNDAIVNVTLESTPALILRERQNAGRIRAAGVEIEADTRLGQRFGASAALAYTNSVFTEGAGLEGFTVPQVPRWQGSIGVHGRASDLSFAADWRASSSQFDDDRNQLRLDPYAMLNGRVGWRLSRTVEIFVAIENAFDEEQDVGRTPVRTIGLPRTTRVGVRLGRW